MTAERSRAARRPLSSCCWFEDSDSYLFCRAEAYYSTKSSIHCVYACAIVHYSFQSRCRRWRKALSFHLCSAVSALLAPPRSFHLRAGSARRWGGQCARPLLMPCASPPSLLSHHFCPPLPTLAPPPILQGRKLVVAHVGDCRVVLCRERSDGDGGNACECIELTADHKSAPPAPRTARETPAAPVSQQGQQRVFGLDRASAQQAAGGCEGTVKRRRLLLPPSLLSSPNPTAPILEVVVFGV